MPKPSAAAVKRTAGWVREYFQELPGHLHIKLVRSVTDKFGIALPIVSSSMREPPPGRKATGGF
ncbi:hypothetical protein LVJ94_05545 [Pendulispora rubella]|uniref:Uncharacterized protein n=1 Tax=Pendulispora rubella TaxID=2741070 RepID=A0ABZ2L6Z3_9BACT